MSDGWTQKPPSRKSSFSLRTGFWKQAAPSASLPCGPPGWAAGSGRPRSPGARIRLGGYAGAQQPAGTRNWESRALVPSRAEGWDPRVDGEVRTKAALHRDSLEEREEDAKNKSKPIKCSATSRVAVTQRCSALSVNELLSTFPRHLERDGSPSSPPQPVAFACPHQPI